MPKPSKKHFQHEFASEPVLAAPFATRGQRQFPGHVLRMVEEKAPGLIARDKMRLRKCRILARIVNQVSANSHPLLTLIVR